jgi:hypothetical protein
MLAASGAEPVGEPDKVRLVDSVQYSHQRSLDDLVFERGSPRGRIRPSGLGIYWRRDGSARYAPRWTRPCKSTSLPGKPASY